MLRYCLILLLSTVMSAPAFAGGYGGRYHYGYGGYYGHHGGGDEGAALLAGLVIGGLLGFFINEDRHYRRQAYWDESYPDYGYYPPRHRDYRYGTAHYRHREYVPVMPRSEAVGVPTQREFAGHTCRMTREYNTTVEIDGERHEAYGTKCLTSDGSWVLGRPKLVPEFD